MLLTILVAALLCVSSVFGGSCESPRATSSFYTTKDAFFHMSTTFIVEFVLHCQNDVQELSLYAEVNGRLLPAAISEETSKYQVSWTEEHKDAHAGKYIVNVFDEDGYAAVRKAQRSGGDASQVTPLFKVDVDHPGTSSGPYLSTEIIMLLCAVLLYYIAFTAKSNLQN